MDFARSFVFMMSPDLFASGWVGHGQQNAGALMGFVHQLALLAGGKASGVMNFLKQTLSPRR
jgi:hypothetical protein